MSVEAISWALNLAPVPRDGGGQPSSACKFVLVGLANHAGPDGTAAFPSVATLVRYTGLSERTVRTCLDRLEAEGIISPCDPDVVAARIKRADRRPQGWDLSLSQEGRDVADRALGGPDYRDLGQADRHATSAAQGGRADEVQSRHPDSAGFEVVDGSFDGVRSLHPPPETGCNRRRDGVQPAQARGAAAAPEPHIEPPVEPSGAPVRSREARLRGDRRPGGGAVGEFFDELGGAWRMTATQKARLGPAVEAALGAGWTPAGLASFTGANTGGVRSPYAVLAARLSTSQLPEPPAAKSIGRPTWCGKCVERTRRCEDADGADAGRCPACHPLASHMRTASGADLVPGGLRTAVLRNMRRHDGGPWSLRKAGIEDGRADAPEYGRLTNTLVADPRADQAGVVAIAQADALLPELPARPFRIIDELSELLPDVEAGE